MSLRVSLGAGLVALALCAAGLFFATKAALLGWLVAFLAFSSVPIGCLSVLMMVVLVPGSWRQLYTGPLLAGSALLPVAAIAVIPILFGLGTLYSWTDPAVTAHYPAFKAAWLSPALFIARQIAYWAILLGIWAALLLLPAARAAISAFGLIADALVGSWMGIDLAETLTPDFHSSIYGLLILAGQWLSGLAFGIAVGLGLTGKWRAAPISAAGALMVALLMWAYFQAMQFIVMWSGDLPDEVGWYLVRGTGAWAWVTVLLFLGQGLVPFFVLLSPAVRSSTIAMTAIALVTLAMRAIESAWLMLPGQSGALPVFGFALLALVAMGGLGAAAIQALRTRRPGWFDGKKFFPEAARA
jgi:hypothetical protein